MKVKPIQQLKPAFPAIAAALICLLLWCWSTFVVQPRMIGWYEERCHESLLNAEMINSSGKSLDLTNWLADVPQEKLVARRKWLDEASLYLRRLIDVKPDVVKLNLQLALTQDASAQLNAKLSDKALSNGETLEAEAFKRRAISDGELAQDAMARLSRTDGDEALLAKSWELARTLKRPVRDELLVEQLETTAMDVLQKDPKNRIGLVRLGQLLTMQAYSMDRSVASDERARNIGKAVELLAAIESPSMIEQSILAEAQDALAPEQSIQTSIAASQRFWGEVSSQILSPEGLAAVFSCLARIGSLQEGQSVVVEKLHSLSSDEQVTLRGLCSDFCLRSIACQNAFPFVERPLKSSDALSIATRIDPQSLSVQKLLERLVVNDVQDSVSQVLCSELDSGKDAPLKNLISSVRQALKGQWSESRDESRLAFESDTGTATVAVALMGRLIESGAATMEQTIQFLENALEIAPDSTGLYFACAVFFEKHDELERASKCLEKVLVKSNSDTQLLTFLASIYARLDRSEDLKRVQLELQRLRKRQS